MFIFSFGCTVGNKSEFLRSARLTEEEFQENPIINWDAILWVNRPTALWAIQLILALISLTEALLVAYLGYKVRKDLIFGSSETNINNFVSFSFKRVTFGNKFYRFILY